MKNSSLIATDFWFAAGIVWIASAFICLAIPNWLAAYNAVCCCFFCFIIRAKEQERADKKVKS